MSLSDLASLGSFVSGIAVVLSFVFLAMQIRQSARNQRATIHNERTALVQELLMAASEGEAAEIRARGDAADQSLDATQSQKYLMRSLATLRLLEELFYQHADGMLDEVRWETNILRVRTFLRAPGFRAAWRTQSETFRSDFGLWIDTIMRETPVISNPNAAGVSAWKEFSRQELARAHSAPS